MNHFDSKYQLERNSMLSIDRKEQEKKLSLEKEIYVYQTKIDYPIIINYSSRKVRAIITIG